MPRGPTAQKHTIPRHVYRRNLDELVSMVVDSSLWTLTEIA